MRVRDSLAFGAAQVEDRLSRDDAFRRLAALAAAEDPALDQSAVKGALLAREAQGGTIVADGLAIPHAILPKATKFQVLPLLVKSGIEWDGPHSPITLVICIIGPSTQPWNHVQLLARLARILRDPASAARLRGSIDSASLEAALREEDQRHD